MDEDLDIKYIKLQSSNNKIFVIDVQVAKVSVTIKTMLEDFGMETDENTIVPLPNVNSRILRKVLKWAKQHYKDPEPIEDDEFAEFRTMSSFDINFLLDLKRSTLFQLIRAANYLDVRGLMELTCKAVANMMKGKTPKKIRKMFKIVNDLWPEEKKKKAPKKLKDLHKFYNVECGSLR